MAIERTWERIAPVLFTVDGTDSGTITVVDTCPFRVKQKVVVCSTTQPDLTLQIKEIPSPTRMIVGPIRDKTFPQKSINNLLSRTDISAYTITDGANVRLSRQPKVRLDPRDIIQASYEQEPVLGFRNFPVDCYGDPYTKDNPFHVTGFVVTGGAVAPSKKDIQNITVANANTEFKVDFPDDTKCYNIRVRDGKATAKVGCNANDTVNGPYQKLRKGTSFVSPAVDLPDNSSVWVQASVAGVILEVVSWQTN